MSQFWPKTGPGLGQNGQNLIKIIRKPNKTTLVYVFKPWILFFVIFLEIGLYRVKIGQFRPKLVPIWTKMVNIPLSGLESQMRPIFHMFQALRMNILKFGLNRVKISHFWPKIGQDLGQNGQNRIKIPGKPKKTNFPYVFKPWILFFVICLETGLNRGKIGQFRPKLVQIWTKMAKILSSGRESQIRHGPR